MMRFSIVTPSLNQGRFLGEALESVRLQHHPDVEHLVLDGDSSDHTVALLRSLDGKPEWKHVCWRSEADSGQSDALNRGFLLASGDIIGWLNSDDRYRPGCFDHVAQLFAEHPEVDVVYGDFALMNEEGAVEKVRREIEFNRFILLYHHVLYIPTPATFLRRRIFEDGNRLRPDLHYAMDYEFFLRLANAGYRIRHIPRVLADFRVHPASKSCRMELLQAAEKRGVMLAVSPLSARIRSPYLRRAVFAGLQLIAGVMRWSEKLLRGYYFAPSPAGSPKPPGRTVRSS
jgi:glycosyltransferase involved in cell wall biosynthesis